MERVLPAGYVSLGAAWLEFQTKHPDYAGNLPPPGNARAEAEWHARHNEVIGRLESLLLDSLTNDELHDYVLIRHRDNTWTEHRLPREYWRDADGNTPGFAACSFATGDVVGWLLSDADKHLDGAPLVFRERDWQDWLARQLAAAQPAPATNDPDAFSLTYWTLIQTVAWVFLRNRHIVELVTGDARLSRQYRAEALLPDGRKVMATQNVGRATDLTLDLYAATSGDTHFKSAVEAGEAILERMRAGEVVGYGRENGSGDMKEIPPISIIDASLNLDPEGIGPKFGKATRWQDVRFKRADIVALWPGEGETGQSPTREVARQKEQYGSRRKPSEQELTDWYQQRISQCEAIGERPSRKQDEHAAREAFGPGLSLRVRALRRKRAPAAWKGTGNKGHKLAVRSGRK